MSLVHPYSPINCWTPDRSQTQSSGLDWRIDNADQILTLGVWDQFRIWERGLRGRVVKASRFETTRPLCWGSNPMRGSCQFLTEGCWLTPRNNVFLQLWKLTAIYNPNMVENGVKHQFTIELLVVGIETLKNAIFSFTITYYLCTM